MALSAAEQESIETLKIWWQGTGRLVLLVLVVLLGGYGGWAFWKNSTVVGVAEASDLYEEMVSIAANGNGQAPDAGSRERITQIADRLRAEYGDSIYARYATLFSAQQAAENNQLARAESDLQWILDNQRQGLFGQIDEGLALAASLRLGRIILARGEPERALGLINQIDPGSFEPGFAELRGDIYLAMERLVDARDAYMAAQQAGSFSNSLYLKLNNLPDPD